jgi:hypothetical protein
MSQLPPRLSSQVTTTLPAPSEAIAGRASALLRTETLNPCGSSTVPLALTRAAMTSGPKAGPAAPVFPGDHVVGAVEGHRGRELIVDRFGDEDLGDGTRCGVDKHADDVAGAEIHPALRDREELSTGACGESRSPQIRANGRSAVVDDRSVVLDARRAHGLVGAGESALVGGDEATGCIRDGGGAARHSLPHRTRARVWSP